MSEINITVTSPVSIEVDEPVPNLTLPSSERLELMHMSMKAANEIGQWAEYHRVQEDAAVVVTAILSAIDTLNRRSVDP